MELSLTAEEEAFRTELRDWLSANKPEGWGSPGFRYPREPQERLQFLRDWQGKLDAAGWVGVNWPKSAGGRDASLVQQVLYHIEMADAPPLVGQLGLTLCGPTILVHGTDAQRDQFLAPMRSGAHIWCEGFSEPDAGSDLASLRTTGQIDGDQLIITGQKIWTSGAQLSDWMFALVRTDATAPKREGISFVLIPMSAGGITVRPIRRLSGDEDFNAVFLDEVRIPLANVVGRLNGGWGVARTTLSHERATVFLANQVRVSRVLDEVIKAVRSDRSRQADPHLRTRVARAWASAQLIQVNGMRNLNNVLANGEPGPEGAMSKLFGQESEQLLYELALDAGGPRSLLDRGAAGAPGNGKWALGWLRTRASTIGGGTSEVQRNVLAERVLGLPRDPWADD